MYAKEKKAYITAFTGGLCVLSLMAVLFFCGTGSAGPGGQKKPVGPRMVYSGEEI